MSWILDVYDMYKDIRTFPSSGAGMGSNRGVQFEVWDPKHILEGEGFQFRTD